jgi:hypothetical protein
LRNSDSWFWYIWRMTTFVIFKFIYQWTERKFIQKINGIWNKSNEDEWQNQYKLFWHQEMNCSKKLFKSYQKQ